MPLLKFWKSSREEVLKLSVEQVLASAGDGNLRDHNEGCEELRQFFKVVPSDRLFAYRPQILAAREEDPKPE